MTRLVKNFTHVGFGFTKPHSQKFRTFDADEVSLALVRDRLGEKRLTATRRTVEEHTLGWRHTKLLELFRVFDRVLNSLLKLLLDGFEATDVIPGDVWNFDHGFTERGRIGGGQRRGEVFVRNGHGNPTPRRQCSRPRGR